MKDMNFGEFRLDMTNECLWRGARSISLRPKAFAVLKMLVEHPGQLVNKQEILESVWPGTFVGDAVLKSAIIQLREALHDKAGSPLYIETAHRRGYRFIGKFGEPALQSNSEHAPYRDTSDPSVLPSALGSATNSFPVLGRETELARMHAWLKRALAGERQAVFITGEAGIGKTTVVEAFLHETAQTAGLLVARGQCMEHFGSGEAYLPVLEGFSRLCHSSAHPRVLEMLRRHAPSWLAHLSFVQSATGESPSLESPWEANSRPAPAPGVSRERMLREMAEVIERMTDESPLLLVLEDLHWSDYSTLDLIAYLARRRDPARLMIIATYRPVDVILADHPLKGVKSELQAHKLCHELPLDYLTEDALSQYLSARFPGHQFPSRLRNAIYRRTEGNPLFMVNLVEYLFDQKLITEEQGTSQKTWMLSPQWSDAEHGVPASVKELIEKQISRLSADERCVLEAASAAGMEFSTVAIAASLERPVEWVEATAKSWPAAISFYHPPGWESYLAVLFRHVTDSNTCFFARCLTA